MIVKMPMGEALHIEWLFRLAMLAQVSFALCIDPSPRYEFTAIITFGAVVCEFATVAFPIEAHFATIVMAPTAYITIIRYCLSVVFHIVLFV